MNMVQYLYCHPNLASFMILHPLTADAVLKCQVITQHSPTWWSTGQFHPIPFSLPYCINCPLHLHFHPSLTGHVSVLDVSFFSIFAINIQCPSFHWAIWLSPKFGDASTHLMVGCSYDDNQWRHLWDIRDIHGYPRYFNVSGSGDTLSPNPATSFEF